MALKKNKSVSYATLYLYQAKNAYAFRRIWVVFFRILKLYIRGIIQENLTFTVRNFIK